MTLPNALETTEIGPEINKVFALIATAGAHLEEGRIIELSALEDRVGTLCSALLGVPGDIARAHAGALQDIIVALDGLNTEINHRVRALAAGPVAPDPALAAGAYSKAES